LIIITVYCFDANKTSLLACLINEHDDDDDDDDDGDDNTQLNELCYAVQYL